MKVLGRFGIHGGREHAVVADVQILLSVVRIGGQETGMDRCPGSRAADTDPVGAIAGQRSRRLQ